ncbi:MAG: hypothetical protein HXX15_10480 [Rhodopseudomonas sp.]|uniref:hypothetical protein n=1 Tax=Rhodopseudomonas sp. TaxID=1078 RepID=UPI00185609EB|nr:hypothetical protein [Rhodopseudomonas sp.]NVN86501.1 hypothetical protein [Rhodopseudomonas sp.]
MEFDTTNCNWCGSTIPMGVTTCPCCGGIQRGSGRANPVQPGMLIAIALSAAVLLAWNWFKATPH